MKEEIFESVLNEIIEEQKQFTLVCKNLQQQLTLLTEKVGSFDQRLNAQVVAPPVDTSPLEQLTKEALLQIILLQKKNVDKLDQQVADITGQLNHTLTTGLQKTNAILEAQPKPIVRQWRICFFPEHDPHGNFRFFVNRGWIGIGVLGILAVLFGLGWMWLSNIHSERLSVPSASRELFPAASSAAPYPSSAPNTAPTHHHHSSTPKKKNPDSLQTTDPGVADSTIYPHSGR